MVNKLPIYCRMSKEELELKVANAEPNIGLSQDHNEWYRYWYAQLEKRRRLETYLKVIGFMLASGIALIAAL